MTIQDTRAESVERMEEIAARMEEIGAKHRPSRAEETEWDELSDEFDALKTQVRRIDFNASVRTAGTPGSAYQIDRGSNSDDDRVSHRDPAMRAIDRCVSDGTIAARGAETIEHAISVGTPMERSWTARWAAATADPHYLAAFAKVLRDPIRGHMLFTNEEAEAFRVSAQVGAERAMSLTDNAGGALIPAQLDPAILLSSAGSANPLRMMARTVQCAGDVWNGVSSSGVSAQWLDEAAEAADASPTLAQPAIPLYKLAAWIPFSIEVEQDAVNFVSEISRLLLDSVEQLTATAYVTGSGVGEPTGFITALAGGSSIVSGDGSEIIADSDPVKLQNSLPARFQMNSAFAAALPTINTFRLSETSNGALLYPSLQNNPPTMLGRQVYEVSNMDSTINAAASEANHVLAVGDWSHLVIADKIGATIELVSHVFGSNQRPTGQRGFFCHMRTGSDVVVDNAIRVLNVPATA